MNRSQVVRPLNRADSQHRPVMSVVAATTPRQHGYGRIILVTALLLAALVIPILINAHMAQVAHALRDDQIALEKVRTSNEQMRINLKQMQSAPELAKKAREAGMVPAGKPGTINLKDGSIQSGTPATGAN